MKLVQLMEIWPWTPKNHVNHDQKELLPWTLAATIMRAINPSLCIIVCSDNKSFNIVSIGSLFNKAFIVTRTKESGIVRIFSENYV